MKLRLILRTLASTPWITAFKVLALGVGLAIGGFLLMRVAHDNSYDTCYPDYKRICQVWVNTTYASGESNRNDKVDPILAEEIRTRLADRIDGVVSMDSYAMVVDAYGSDSREPLGKVATFQCSDGFFDTFGLELLQGSGDVVDGQPMIWLSDEMAESLFGDSVAVGQRLMIQGLPSCVVGGVYRKLPEESSIFYMNSFVSDGKGPTSMIFSPKLFLKLKRGEDREAFALEVNKIWQTLHPDSEDKAAVIDVAPLRDTTVKTKANRQRTLMMSLLAAVVLLVTVMNYILLSLASLRQRARVVGVQKCFGASAADVMAMFAGETAVVMLGAFAVMALLYLWSAVCFTDTVHYYVTDHVAFSRLWVLAAVVGVVFVAAAAVPAAFMARIPVQQVFRTFKHRRGVWKRTLLFLEIGILAFVAGLMIAIMVQYHHVSESAQGFSKDGLVEIDNIWDRNHIVSDMLDNEPYVKSYTSATFYPGSSGLDDTVYPDEDSKTGTDVYTGEVDIEFFKTMEIPLLVGGFDGAIFGPSPYVDDDEEDDEDDTEMAAVSRRFADVMGWDIADAVGKTFCIHNSYVDTYSYYRVKAVYEDFMFESFYRCDMLRPSFLSIVDRNDNAIRYYVKVADPIDENVERLSNDMRRLQLDNEYRVSTYRELQMQRYAEVNVYRIMVLVSAAMIMLIAAMGLLAYLRDEVAQRTKEIAIRKISGASAADIVEMLARSVMLTAVPAIVVGTVAAWLVGRDWLAQFAVTADGIVWLQCLGALGVAVVVAAIAAALTLRTALDNPVNSLRNE